ncbi:hypothetical protein B566_EDAN001304 [Ephemera danica]|nr:hypothetical protein B566_EDAN001304 [Ephemera danica]
MRSRLAIRSLYLTAPQELKANSSISADRGKTCVRSSHHFSGQCKILSNGWRGEPEQERQLWVNCAEVPEVAKLHKRFPDNRVVTSKYTIWSFLPKNLFEQFRRVANASIDSPVSYISVLWPLCFVIAITAVKQAFEDWKRHRGDRIFNDAKVTVLRNGREKEVKALEIRVGEIVRVVEDQPVPCDILLMGSSAENGICHVTTANLDGETSLKTLKCPRILRNLHLGAERLRNFRAQVTCDPPSVDLYKFHGRLELLPDGPGPLKSGSEFEALDTANLALRGATLRNTEFVYGCAIYTGQETKLTLNTFLSRNKFSTAEKTINKFLLYCFLPVLVGEVIFCSAMKYGLEATNWVAKFDLYLGPKKEVQGGLVLQDILSFWVLYFYLFPIALYVSVELQKFVGVMFFGWDLEMYCPSMDEAAFANSSDISEELGQVEYLFADKTGTLTENDMVFRRCSISGICYEEKAGNLLSLEMGGDDYRLFDLPAEAQHFFLTLALCHTVQVSTNTDGIIEYQADNPDEKALVEAADRCGISFLGEKADELKIRYGAKERTYKRLEMIAFTSERRCMSVVVEDNEGKIWLVCKGAESSVLPMCSSGPRIETFQHVSEFAVRGLRTMVVARRALSPEQWQDLRNGLQRAQQTIGANRAEALIAASAALETDLTLLGSCGIEDRLQPGVSDTLESLKAAGLKVWILTGDKVETAVNFGLVMDGASLALALKSDRKLLLDLSTQCSTVIACRLSPLQKSEMVALIKTLKSEPITAAVGDGIVGKEGRQAARSSDFSIPRFRHIKRAFFVHGHWYYVRVANLIQYFCYKSVAFITPQFFFSIHCLFSTQALYTEVFMICFNLLYASIPPLAYSFLEQDLPDKKLLENPQEYKKLSRNSMLTWPLFFAWFFSGVWHAVVIFYGTLIMITINNASILSNNGDLSRVAFSLIISHTVTMVTNLKIWLVSRYWTAPFIGTIIFSMSIYIASTIGFGLMAGAQEYYMAYLMLLKSPSFWLLTVVLIVACLIPDFAMAAFKQMVPPHMRKLPWSRSRRRNDNFPLSPLTYENKHVTVPVPQCGHED